MFNRFKKWWRTRRGVFAYRGQEVTCENGHVVCEVANTIHIGSMYNEKQFTRWRQPPPQHGAFDPKCDVCGAKYWHGQEGQNFHFADGWRLKSPWEAPHG